MICLRTLLRIYEKNSNPKKLKNKFFGCLKLPAWQKKVFLGPNNITNLGSAMLRATSDDMECGVIYRRDK
jgi:hypothetical protein